MRIVYVKVLLDVYLVVMMESISRINGIYTETNWKTTVEINEYKSYASSSSLYFTVPQLAVHSTWLLNAYKSPNTDKCEIRTVVLFLQPGSFPVITPLNETFPEDFSMARTKPQRFEFLSNNESFNFTIDNPLPGGWYAKIYLGDFIDDSIKQKDLGTECKYYMGSVHVIEAIEVVEEQPLHIPIVVIAMHESLKIYRFHTSMHTWQYEVHAEECIVNMSTSLSPCPIRLSTRALALPMFDGTSNVVDCNEYNSSKCILLVTSPATMDWHYITFESTCDEYVQFLLTVKLITCSGSTTLQTKTLTVTIHQNGTHYSNNSHYFVKGTAHDIDLNSKNNEMELLSDASTLKVFDSLTLEHSQYSDIIHNTEDSSNETENTCQRLPELGRYEIPTKIFDVEFKLRMYIIPIMGSIVVTDNKPVILHFKLQPDIDIGGTLKYSIQMETKYLNNSKQTVKIHSCIQRLGIPATTNGVSCHEENYMQVKGSGTIYRQLYFPYPEPGSWYIALMAHCVNAKNETQSEKCIQDTIAAIVKIQLKPCVDGACGEYGSCYTYYSNHHRYSSCSCLARYRGYGCTDDAVADPDSIQLASALLLTLSNLMFIPAITVSLYRHFFPEALSYTFTMFFSTFYHACDGSRKYVYCMMSYNILSYCDFFGAIMSVWVTFVALSCLSDRKRSFLFLFAGMIISMAVTWDKYSLWTFVVPTLGGIILMTASWRVILGWWCYYGDSPTVQTVQQYKCTYYLNNIFCKLCSINNSQKCYQRKECYPSKKRWLFFIVPGLMVAGSGMIVYAFFETEANYWYTHSFWHACMALCIVFVLPPRKYQKTVKLTGGTENFVELPVRNS